MDTEIMDIYMDTEIMDIYMDTEIMNIYMDTEIMDMRKIVGQAASVGDEETGHFQRKKSVRFKS